MMKADREEQEGGSSMIELRIEEDGLAGSREMLHARHTVNRVKRVFTVKTLFRVRPYGCKPWRAHASGSLILPE